MMKGDVLATADTPVGELALRPAVHAKDGSTLGDVAAAMDRAGVSAVLIGPKPFRILTERDLTRALAAGHGPEARALDVASDQITVAAQNLSLGRAAATMVRRGIRHLPVVDADGNVLGMLGMEAVFRVLLRQSDLSVWVADFDGVLADGG